ncbi:MAG TPA: GntR family transcriptional regulator [Rikenellaceae bacterium]|jgi:GntR family transcriptional repressor for pyruvate dehydrogenase complex|nr:GntR family transcriptional regulator [Rikenellaceae bacterium]
MLSTFSHKENSTVKVLKFIYDLINDGKLKPGSKLPAERKLAEELQVGRTHIRNAYAELEFYGIVKTYPQSGSMVAAIHHNALQGLISDIMSIENYDFLSLVETRLILEMEAARLACERADKKDIEALKFAHQDYIDNFQTPHRVEKDMIFHRVIAQASRNDVIKSMLLIITPDILSHYVKKDFCSTPLPTDKHEHQIIIDAIESRSSSKAVAAMRLHLDRLYTFAKNKKEELTF